MSVLLSRAGSESVWSDDTLAGLAMAEGDKAKCRFCDEIHTNWRLGGPDSFDILAWVCRLCGCATSDDTMTEGDYIRAAATEYIEVEGHIETTDV